MMRDSQESPKAKRTRVLFVGPMLGQHPGWVPNPVEDLAPRLSGLGYSSILVSHRLNRYTRLADILWTLYHHRKQIDVISLQVYSGLSFVVSDCASWLSKSLGKPLVMVLHGGDLPEFLTHFPHWTQRVLKRASVIVSPSDFLAHVVAKKGLDAQIIPNAIPVEQYPFRLRQEVRPALLWMRTFHEIYNPLLAIEALVELRKWYPQATLTMAGQEKGMLEQVKQRVQSLGFQDVVQFKGFLNLPAKQREFETHDIFLNTNRIDNMPVSVIEAAAAGFPIVATSVGGLTYLIQNGENGLLTADNDSHAMVAAIRRILEEPGLASRLSANARKLAEQYNWGNILAKWDMLFQSILQSNHRCARQ